MAIRNVKSDVTRHAERVFSDLNLSKKDTTMRMVSFKMHSTEKKELQKIFDDLGLTFSSGMRFALKEFKRNHAI